jgi:hypothetical protein
MEVPRRHLPWGAPGFADGPSGDGDAGEGGGSCLEEAAARVPPCRQRRATRGLGDISIRAGYLLSY